MPKRRHKRFVFLFLIFIARGRDDTNMSARAIKQKQIVHALHRAADTQILNNS